MKQYIVSYFQLTNKTKNQSLSPDSFINNSEATLMLMSWFSRLLFAMGLPSRGFRGPAGRSATPPPTAALGPSWQRTERGKPGWAWPWEREAGLGLKTSSDRGSTFRWNGDFRASLWLAAETGSGEEHVVRVRLEREEAAHRKGMQKRDAVKKGTVNKR